MGFIKDLVAAWHCGQHETNCFVFCRQPLKPTWSPEAPLASLVLTWKIWSTRPPWRLQSTGKTWSPWRSWSSPKTKSWWVSVAFLLSYLWHVDIYDICRTPLPEGPERRSAEIDKKNKRITAYHESGHAIVAYYTKDAMPINKATIMPRGPSLGHVRTQKPKNSYFTAKPGVLVLKISVCVFSGVHAARERPLERDPLSAAGSDGRQHGGPCGGGDHIWPREHHNWYSATCHLSYWGSPGRLTIFLPSRCVERLRQRHKDR